jgi:membrane protease YdiL (CAAX protease family)
MYEKYNESQHYTIVRSSGTPGFRAIILVYLLSILLLIFLGGFFQSQHLLSGLIISELAFVLAPATMYTLRNRYNLSQTFSLVAIQAKTIVLAILISIAAFVLVGIIAALQELLLPRSMDYLEIWEMVLQEFHRVPLIITLLIVAALPGICEELLFRGFLLTGIRKKYSDTVSIILVGFLFGAFHLDPYRFLPVSLLGILFGYMVVKTGSIFSGMIAHSTNNAIAMLISYFVFHANPTNDLLPASPQSEELFTAQNVISLLPIATLALLVLIVSLRGLPSRRAPNYSYQHDTVSSEPAGYLKEEGEQGQPENRGKENF